VLVSQRTVNLAADDHLLLLTMKLFRRGDAAAVLAQKIVDGEGAKIRTSRGLGVAGTGLVRLPRRRGGWHTMDGGQLRQPGRAAGIDGTRPWQHPLGDGGGRDESGGVPAAPDGGECGRRRMMMEPVLTQQGSGVRLRLCRHHRRRMRMYRVMMPMLTEYVGGGGGDAGGASDGGETTARRRAGPPAQLARRAADEHVVGRRVEHPVVALARVVVVARHFDEALVEAEIVPYGVLPALLVLAVVWKVADDELVYAVEREPLVRAAADRHHDHGVVAVRRLLGSR